MCSDINSMFSIVVPVYNAAIHLEATINCVINQTFTDWELLLVDDGSSDDSLKIANKYVKIDDRIKVLFHEGNVNKGISASRNVALQNATGRYVAFLDSDDIWVESKLEIYHDIILSHENNLVLLYSKSVFVDDQRRWMQDAVGEFVYDGTGAPGITHNPFYKIMKRDVSIPTSSVALRKDIVDKIGGFDETTDVVEDVLLWYTVMQYGPIYFLDDVLQEYRIHLGSWNSNNKSMTLRLTRRLSLYEYMLVAVEEKNKSIVQRRLADIGLFVVAKSYYKVEHGGKHAISCYYRVLRNKSVALRYKMYASIMLIYGLLIGAFRSLAKL
jgi:glycosyltransferase involved in cell wall biosynthesis